MYIYIHLHIYIYMHIYIIYITYIYTFIWMYLQQPFDTVLATVPPDFPGVAGLCLQDHLRARVACSVRQPQRRGARRFLPASVSVCMCM